VCFVALEAFVAQQFGVEQLSQVVDRAGVVEVDLQEGLASGVVAVKVVFLFELCLQDNGFVSLEGRLVHSFQFQQKISQEKLIPKRLCIFFSLDVEEGEVAVHMAAAFLILFIGAVDPDDRCDLDWLAFEVLFVPVDGELLVERRVIRRWQLEQVIVVSKSVNAHLQLSRLGVLVAKHGLEPNTIKYRSSPPKLDQNNQINKNKHFSVLSIGPSVGESGSEGLEQGRNPILYHRAL
jgi:hypothetical protein